LIQELTERPVFLDAHPKHAIATGAAIIGGEELAPFLAGREDTSSVPIDGTASPPASREIVSEADDEMIAVPPPNVGACGPRLPTESEPSERNVRPRDRLVELGPLPPPPVRKKSPYLAAVAAAVVISIVVVVVVIVNRRKDTPSTSSTPTTVSALNATTRPAAPATTVNTTSTSPAQTEPATSSAHATTEPIIASPATTAVTLAPAATGLVVAPGALTGVCPATVSIQTDWNPESEAGHIYQLFGSNLTVDAKSAIASAPLIAHGGVDTGVRSRCAPAALRSGSKPSPPSSTPIRV